MFVEAYQDYPQKNIPAFHAFAVYFFESISLLKPLENGGLPDRAKNKSPDKTTEIRHLQDAADVKLQNCD